MRLASTFCHLTAAFADAPFFLCNAQIMHPWIMPSLASCCQSVSNETGFWQHLNLDLGKTTEALWVLQTAANTNKCHLRAKQMCACYKINPDWGEMKNQIWLNGGIKKWDWIPKLLKSINHWLIQPIQEYNLIHQKYLFPKP